MPQSLSIEQIAWEKDWAIRFDQIARTWNIEAVMQFYKGKHETYMFLRKIHTSA